VISGVMSAYAVLRRQSLLGDVMSHAALPGIVIAFLVTGSRASLALMIGAVIAGMIGMLLMNVMVHNTRIDRDTAQGLVLAVFFGFGMALLSWVLRQNNAEHAGLDKFLFGKAAATVAEDVLLMAVTGGIAVVTVLLLWKEFKLLAFDPGFGVSIGMPIALLDAIMTGLIVLVVVIGLQTVGVVLMSAMLVAPGVAARQWTNRLSVMVILSAAFGAIAGVAGALTSAIVLISLIFAPSRGILWERVRRQRPTAQSAPVVGVPTLQEESS
jgi:manganese/zinc/iron transport system permease protein